MTNDSVSILMPSFNAERFIDEAIQSVINQSHPRWELIAIDDGSQDNTRTIIESWRHKDARIKLVTLEANRGASFARNQGLKIATGRYIALLDSDDT